jgi:hypothetical protein
MSGGHFEYNQYKIEEIARDIERLIKENNVEDDWGHANNYSAETIAKFKKAAETCWLAAKMAQRVDWLVSGDDGEDSFHSRWKKEGCGEVR